jgi:Sensors of blue-light using FAD
MWVRRDRKGKSSEPQTIPEAPTLWRLVYVSDARRGLTDNDFDQILRSARRRNFSLDVTGMLMLVGGRFCQILEGTLENVNEVFGHIAIDRLHSNVQVLETKAIMKRSFPDWTMGPPSRTLRQFSDASDVDKFLRGIRGSIVKPDPEARRFMDLALAGAFAQGKDPRDALD